MTMNRLLFVASLVVAVAGCTPTVVSSTTGPGSSHSSSSAGSTSSGGSSSGGVPGNGSLCAVCYSSLDCGEEGSGLCVFENQTATGGYCAPTCTDDGDCADGAACNSTDGQSSVCYPQGGTCVGWTPPATTASTTSGTSGASTSTSGSSSSSSGTTGASCPGYVEPDSPSSCTCPTGHTCPANNCYGGWFCDVATSKCVAPPANCGGTTTAGSTSTSTGASTISSGSTGSHGSTGTSGTTASGAVGPQGGSVDLLHFAISGDTRPPSCEDTTGYPTAIIDSIADAETAAGAQFALDLGDHMYVCNNTASIAQTQMGLFTAATQRFNGTWFMTEGNHECMGAGSGSCPIGSTNVNYSAFMAALAPISTAPYYSVDVQTSLGLARFVFVADNSWDSTEQSWLDQVLTDADTHAKYTFVAKHHPVGDTSVSANTAIIALIRTHKFSILLTGHTHNYIHGTADNGRDVIIGNGGAPLVSAGTFSGYAIVDQHPDGSLKFTMYDVATGLPQDSWTAGPN